MAGNEGNKIIKNLKSTRIELTWKEIRELVIPQDINGTGLKKNNKDGMK